MKVGGYELIDDKDYGDDRQYHHRERKHSEIEPVPALEALGQPMDDHAYDDEDEYIAVFVADLGDDGEVPGGTDLLNHIPGGAPSYFVGRGRIKVGTASEEQAGERDEGEGLGDAPHRSEGLERLLSSAKMVDITHQRAGADDQGPDFQKIEDRGWRDPGQDGTSRRRQRHDRHAQVPVHILPELISYGSQAVEAAPYDEVPAGAMPETAQQHRDEAVHIGGDFLAARGRQPGDDADDGCERQDADTHPDASGEPYAQRCEHQCPEIGPERGVSVSAEGYVQIVLEPAAERHVPSPPEILRIGGLVWRIEILGQVEAHQHRYADGYVGIAREVGIDLERVAEYGAEILEARKQHGIVEHPVDEVHCDVVAQYYLFYQAVKNPEHRDAELFPAEEPRPVHLRDEFAGTDDRPGHELGEETDEESEIQDVVNRLQLSLIDVDGVADDLEGKERDAHRQHDAVHAPALHTDHLVTCPGEHVEDLEVHSEEVVHHVREEIGVLEVAEQEQVDADAQDQPGLFAPLRAGSVYPFGYQEVGAGDEDEYKDGKSAGFVVEEQTDEEQEGIPEEPAALYERKSGEYEGEERPEIKLGEQQGRARVEREHPVQECAYRSRAFHQS